MTDEEILKLDFYDFVGVDAVFYTDQQKVHYYRTVIENENDIFFCRNCMALHEEECCCSENDE